MLMKWNINITVMRYWNKQNQFDNIKQSLQKLYNFFSLYQLNINKNDSSLRI